MVGDNQPKKVVYESIRTNKVAAWFTGREPLFTFIFFIILSVLAFTSVYTARQTQSTLKKEDLIAQCTTPGTRCFNLTAEQKDLDSLRVQTAGFCALSVITQFPATATERVAQQATLRDMYFQCFNDEFAKGQAIILAKYGDTSSTTSSTINTHPTP